VIEFFWYECPHCYAFEPAVAAWSKQLPADVWFHRVPVGFTARHQITQKLYLALEAMGQAEALHQRIFDAIHRQHERLLSEAELVAFVSAHGVDGAKFAEMFRSFQVHTLATRAEQLAEAYKIDGVPAMGVGGRFFTSGSLAGSNEQSLAVVDFLVARLRKPA
jgi:thiol:disulfide interchange protein DsbA